MLVLLVVQAVQVLLLAVAVFVFFVVFGVVAIEDAGRRRLDRARSRVHLPGVGNVSRRAGPGLGLPRGVLAASTSRSTPSPTTTYRQQFFASVMRELERAVGVRAVYLALRATLTRR